MSVANQESGTMQESPHAEGQKEPYDRRSQHGAQLFSIIDKILIACVGVTMDIIAEECWTDKVMGHKSP